MVDKQQCQVPDDKVREHGVWGRPTYSDLIHGSDLIHVGIGTVGLSTQAMAVRS